MKSIIFSVDGRESLINDILLSQQLEFNKTSVVLGKTNIQKFSDGELCVDLLDSVRGQRVYLLSSPNTSDELVKLVSAIDSAKRAEAKEIIVILPYFPYQRQDKKDQLRGPIGAKAWARIFEAIGATSVITYDLHADQIQGFFEIPVTHIEGKNVFDDYISSVMTEQTILCGPDAGSGKRVKRMKEQISKYHNKNLNIVMMDKTRKEANQIDDMVIIGNVEGKDVIIIDDMVDTAGTLCKAAEVLLENGAKSVRAIISHGVLSGPAYDRIEKSLLTELVISDSLPSKPSNKIKVVSISNKIAKAIFAIDNEMSYEALKLGYYEKN